MGRISCQGETLNITPYVTGAGSFPRPWEPYYDDPVYDMSDNSVPMMIMEILLVMEF